MQKILFVLIFSILSINISTGQAPKKLNATEIYQSIQKLNFLGSILYVAAHPDDENTRLISYFSNQLKARTAYLSLTRGDGGQNLIGPEIRELLGVIRTQELLAARKIDGGEQLFTRANDFGYSKHPDETLAIWNKKEVLSDVVWAIRNFKPDVIVNRFDHRTPGSTHGHHTSSAMLSVEAFDISNNELIYPKQLAYTNPWQPKRMFFNTSWWFYGSQEKFDKADKSKLINFDTGVYYPLLGLSNTEISSLSRSQHKSQGFGSTGTRGEHKEYIELIKGDLPKDKSNVFEGIDTSWNRIKGGNAIGTILYKVEKEFNFKNPSASISDLVKAYQLIDTLEDQHWRTIKLKQIKDIIVAVSGLYLETVASESTSTNGSEIILKSELINRSDTAIKLNLLHIPKLGIKDTISRVLAYNSNTSLEHKSTIPSDLKYSNPYWLNKTGTLGMYTVTNQKLIGRSESDRPIVCEYDILIDGIKITLKKNVVFKMNDPVKGESYKPFEITPPISAHIKNKVVIYKNDSTQTISVIIKAGKQNLKGKISLTTPEGWDCSPNTIDFELLEKDEDKTVTFNLKPPAEQSQGYITPKIDIDNITYSNEVIKMKYDHIPLQTVILPSKTKVVKLDIKKKGEHIGYIEGAGDVVPESLKQIGYKTTIIDPVNISATKLKKYDAIVIGIRAYNTIETLKFKQQVLLDYVKNGGTLLVQYNTSHRLKVTDNIGPFPLKLSRDRVTDENAAVTFLSPEHPVLNTPNKITEKDFEGWVQERGLYFPNEWSKEYTAILALNDKGESSKKGSLLVAKYGKGHYIYTGLSFFREFPAGVPGAFRLFANLLSLGK